MTSTTSPTGSQLLSEAIDHLEAGGDSEWIDHAVGVIELIAAQKPALTTDDVWEAVTWYPSEPRAMGAAMRRCARVKLIEKTNRTTKSQRAVCHCRDLAVWRSLVHR